MSMNREGRPTRPEAAENAAAETWTGNRALMLEEPLIFEIGDTETTGIDIDEIAQEVTLGHRAQEQDEDFYVDRLGGLARKRPIGLAGLSEPQAVRHYTRLSRQNYAIDLGLFPLGSCTMKHNPRLCEKVARMPGFADIHPLQPVDTVQGALQVVHKLGEWLVRLTGMHSVAMSPKAGAHGEL
ncbi:MAG: glycine dehydrogenase subunit 2, partial [Sphingomonadales bacterium]|nr:glycine dehydrogenase subunit 2 [Sphingomonadales bacterium]